MNRAEELREHYGVEKGQIWQIGEHRLMCGDAYDEAHRKALLDGKTPDLFHSDPPYGIGIISGKDGASDLPGGSKAFGATSGVERKTSTGFDAPRLGTVQSGPKSKNQILQSNLYPEIEGDDRSFDPQRFLDIAPITVLWGANYYATQLPESECWICWDKRENLTRNNFADCELAWTNQQKPARIFYHLWSGLYKGSQYGEKRTHPTEKPVALYEEVGKHFCPEGLWADFFVGTGAHLIAAQNASNPLYSMEIEPFYAAVALDRIEQCGLVAEMVGEVEITP